MWYVVQVRAGTEENIVFQCRKKIIERNRERGEQLASQGMQGAAELSRILERCFVPYYEQKRKYEGAWHTEQRVLFPGYVFLVSEDVERLFHCLKEVQGLTKLVGTGRDIVPLSEEEVHLLRKLGGDEQLVSTSIGVMVKDQIQITEGPLKGLEGCIKRIDRHKRAAWIEVEMMGRTVEARVGLEVVEKK